jgi:hypothetical protein
LVGKQLLLRLTLVIEPLESRATKRHAAACVQCRLLVFVSRRSVADQPATLGG